MPSQRSDENSRHYEGWTTNIQGLQANITIQKNHKKVLEHSVDIPICTAHPFIFFMGDKILDKSTKLGSSLLLGVHFKRALASVQRQQNQNSLLFPRWLAMAASFDFLKISDKIYWTSSSAHYPRKSRKNQY